MCSLRDGKNVSGKGVSSNLDERYVWSSLRYISRVSLRSDFALSARVGGGRIAASARVACRLACRLELGTRVRPFVLGCRL